MDLPFVIIRPECRKDAAKQAEEWGKQAYKVLPALDVVELINIVTSQIQIMLDFNATQDPRIDITAKISLPVGRIKFILQNP
jgi:hypothetical protein